MTLIYTKGKGVGDAIENNEIMMLCNKMKL